MFFSCSCEDGQCNFDAAWQNKNWWARYESNLPTVHVYTSQDRQVRRNGVTQPGGESHLNFYSESIREPYYMILSKSFTLNSF